MTNIENRTQFSYTQRGIQCQAIVRRHPILHHTIPFIIMPSNKRFASSPNRTSVLIPLRSEESKQDGDLDDWIMTVKGQHFGNNYNKSLQQQHNSMAMSADESSSPGSMSLPHKHQHQHQQHHHNNGGGAATAAATSSSSGGSLVLQTNSIASSTAATSTTPTTPTATSPSSATSSSLTSSTMLTNSNGPSALSPTATQQRDANLNHYKLSNPVGVFDLYSNGLIVLTNCNFPFIFE